MYLLKKKADLPKQRNEEPMAWISGFIAGICLVGLAWWLTSMGVILW